MAQIRNLLETGRPYGRWTPAQRLRFIFSVVEEVGQIKRFNVPAAASDWQPILRWWLVHDRAAYPAANKIAEWHQNVHQWFGYRFCWGIGSVIGVAFEDVSDSELRATTLEDWERTGLPWVTFWLKELIAWGTLDPIAAFLLSSGVSLTRAEAEQQAAAYYDSFAGADANELLDPRAIRNWVGEVFPRLDSVPTESTHRRLPAKVVDSSIQQTARTYRVLPIHEADSIGWIDVAGYLLARSPKNVLREFDGQWQLIDFVLDARAGVVDASAYL
jgi:hypothetical protein